MVEELRAKLMMRIDGCVLGTALMASPEANNAGQSSSSYPC